MLIKLATLDFSIMENRTEKELLDFIYREDNLSYLYFIVSMRYIYEWDNEWIYSVEVCKRYYDDMNICWFSDWNEGQEIVEYIAVSPIIDD